MRFRLESRGRFILLFEMSLIYDSLAERGKKVEYENLREIVMTFDFYVLELKFLKVTIPKI